MPSLRALSMLLAVLILALPATALGQTDAVPAPGDGPGLSDQPPVDLGGDGDGDGAPAPDDPAPPGDDGASAPADELPRTGSDAWMLFLTGLSVTLVGLGLRLRTADADLF